MTIDIVKVNVTIHVETSGDTTTTDFLLQFAQVIKLVELATDSIVLERAHCRFIVNGNWKSEYDINGIPRTFSYETDISAVPHLVKTTSNEWFNELERATIETIHVEIEKLRVSHQLTKFDWVNN